MRKAKEVGKRAVRDWMKGEDSQAAMGLDSSKRSKLQDMKSEAGIKSIDLKHKRDKLQSIQKT